MSSFGRVFRVTTYGESHGKSIGCIIEGMPSNFPVSLERIQAFLNRRKPGQSSITTSRNESDQLEVHSGIQEGVTLGTPICFSIRNQDTRPSDYTRAVPRPGHADMTYRAKYKIASDSGGGRASARETAARVAAGGLAMQYLDSLGISIVAWVHSVSTLKLSSVPLEGLTSTAVDRLGTVFKVETNEGTEVIQQDCEGEVIESIQTRCPNSQLAVQIAEAIAAAKAEGDSLGGVIRCVCTGVPAGLGEPCFDKLQAVLGHAMLSIPAVKGFEIGSGFKGTKLRGSQHNDVFQHLDGALITHTNHAGGVLGGISNGNVLDFKVAFKPVSTIAKPQVTADWEGNLVELVNKGRHDPCVLPRAVPIVEAMAALVLIDFILLQKSTSL